MREMSHAEAVVIAVDCLRAHALGTAGIFEQAAEILETSETWTALYEAAAR
jgi:hypothetical protein